MVDGARLEVTVTRPSEVEKSAQERVVRLRDGLPFCLTVFLAARIGLSVLGVATVGTVQPPSSAGAGVEVPATPGLHNAVDGLDRWDAGWFERIARSGYDATGVSAAFFPGYPIAIRGVSSATSIGSIGSAMIVSELSFLGALIVLFALTTREYSTDMARRTVLLLTIFPASFFFYAPYSESLFLLSSVLAFWFARGGRPWSAGVAGFVSAATRSLGILLVPALVVEALARSRERGRALAASLIPLLAPALYGVYWLSHSGSALQPVHAQDAWYRTFEIPVVTLGNALWLGISGITDRRGIYWTADVILVAALLIPLAWRWRVIPRSYLVYVVATLLVVLSYPLPERPLLSVPRFLIVLFPIFWSLASLLTERRRLVAVSLASIVGYVALATAFMNWGFVF
jgi:Mannosyltransferase (PIG-V)